MLVINSMGSMHFNRMPAGIRQINAPEYALGRLEELMRSERCLVLFEGGADINPQLYGEENLYSGWVSHRRDEWESALYTLARRTDTDMLGICRGHQLMAALAGGALYQDVRAQVGKAHAGEHEIVCSSDAVRYDFALLMLSNPTGSPHVINSLHHQAVKRLPPDAIELARALDGVNEALLYPWGLSVQWHPEFLGHSEFLLWMRDVFPTVQARIRDDNAEHNNGGGIRVPQTGDISNIGAGAMAEIPSAQ
jgi:gamma-glutamyl-gamma-aminobutyrate hydrolase PuuD